MANRSVWKTWEWARMLGALVVCAVIALRIKSRRSTRVVDDDSPSSNDRLRQTDHMANRSVWKTWEWAWMLGVLVVCTVIALVLIDSIPVVNKLPEGTSSVTEYVVDATVARFGIPVVVFLFLAAAVTTLGHNKGDGRPGLDFASKVFNLGAATFSLWAVLGGFMAGGSISS